MDGAGDGQLEEELLLAMVILLLVVAAEGLVHLEGEVLDAELALEPDLHACTWKFTLQFNSGTNWVGRITRE